MTETFGLVACSKSKCGGGELDREFPAEDLYDSWLFDGRVRAVKAHCSDWAIFSAKHGYVEPDDRLTWYDKRITELDPEDRRELAADVAADLPNVDRVMILMGRDYANPLKAALPDDIDVWDPLEGVALFDQRAELRDLASTTEQARLVTDGGRAACDTETDRFEPGWYVIAEPHQDPAKVVAGPMDHDAAESRAHFETAPNACIMHTPGLVNAVKHHDYSVQWRADIEKPDALVSEEVLP